MPDIDGTILALDVGTVRIGVARASTIARLASPLTTLANDAAFAASLSKLIDDESAVKLIVGLPRNLSGEDTPQTQYVRDFMTSLEDDIKLPIAWQDEALTSNKAEHELQARGKLYTKGDIDALAATYILEDYLNQGA
jgi:putative Holliday junction resolvase